MGRRGRKRINEEQILARLPAGTLARIAAVLDGGETRADLLRDAIEREITRRSLVGATDWMDDEEFAP